MFVRHLALELGPFGIRAAEQFWKAPKPARF